MPAGADPELSPKNFREVAVAVLRNELGKAALSLALAEFRPDPRRSEPAEFDGAGRLGPGRNRPGDRATCLPGVLGRAGRRGLWRGERGGLKIHLAFRWTVQCRGGTLIACDSKPVAYIASQLEGSDVP